MRSFILVSFVLMGLAYWAMSGGASFEPEAWPDTVADTAAGDATAGGVEVATRADTSLDALAQVAPAAPGATASPGAQTALAPQPVTAPAVPSRPLAPGEALAAIAPDLGAPATAAASAQTTSLGSDPGADLRQVTGDRVNMREGPGTDFAVVDQMATGEVAEVLEAEGSWLRVRAAGGAEGWMSERFLAPDEG